MKKTAFSDIDTSNLDRERIGRQIRDLRKSQGVKLAEVALKAGKSIGYISQVERGVSSLSIPVLQSISNILGVNITWFFNDEQPDTSAEEGRIVRSSARRHLNFVGEGIKEEMLSPWMNGDFLMLLATFYPGSQSDREPRKRMGQESGYVQSGSLELVIDGHTFLLNTGDSFSIAEDEIYHALNPSKKDDCVVMWVLSPSSF